MPCKLNIRREMCDKGYSTIVIFSRRGYQGVVFRCTKAFMILVDVHDTDPCIPGLCLRVRSMNLKPLGTPGSACLSPTRRIFFPWRVRRR